MRLAATSRFACFSVGRLYHPEVSFVWNLMALVVE